MKKKKKSHAKKKKKKGSDRYVYNWAQYFQPDSYVSERLKTDSVQYQLFIYQKPMAATQYPKKLGQWQKTDTEMMLEGGEIWKHSPNK